MSNLMAEIESPRERDFRREVERLRSIVNGEVPVELGVIAKVVLVLSDMALCDIDEQRRKAQLQREMDEQMRQDFSEARRRTS